MNNIHTTPRGAYLLKWKEDNDLYEIHSVRNAFEGTLMSIAKKACSLGVKKSHLIYALEEMHSSEMNVAEFTADGNLMTMYRRV